MKAAIITIIDRENIGNRLQNYAVQELLKKHNLEVSTIEYYNSNDDAGLMETIKTNIYYLLLKVGFFKSTLYIDFIRKNPKLSLVKEFNKNYIEISNKYIFKSKSIKKMRKYASDFDYYCIGSDQIWNSFRVQNNGFFFARFVESEKCFSFSASMGTTHVDSKYSENFQKGFTHLGNVSVREIETKELINKLANRDASLLFDPTILLERVYWLRVAQRPKFTLPERFIVTYFLSEQTSSQQRIISQYARMKNLEIIEMNNKHKSFVGPSEFVYLINKAEYIFTDSFHGVAFSVSFNKRFIVFNRNNTFDMSARITTLLGKLNLLDRFYKCNNNELNDEFFSYINGLKDYNVDEQIRVERQRAEEFLNRCITNGDV